MGFTPADQTLFHAASLELRELWTMAAPITAMNLLVFLRAMISILSLGRLGRLELAGGAMSIGFTNITGYSVLFGLASGLEPLCSQAFGSQNLSLVSLSFQRTIILLLLSSLPISLLWLNLNPILSNFLKQDPEITAIAATFCLYSIPDLVTNSFLQPLRVYLRSQGITKPLMWCSAIAVVLHVPLNLVLVFYMEMGVVGVAIAQVLTNLNMVVFLLGYLYFSRVCERSWTGWSREGFRELGPLMKLALPSCLGVCLEWWWYEIMTLLAGYLPNPKVAVGATAILIQTTSFMYTFPMALGACVSTRVGNELGAGRPDKAKTAAAVALGCAVVIGLANVVWTAALPTKWASLFTTDAAVISLASSALPLLGLCELGNCPQTTGCGVLRGTARPATAARINLFSFYLVGTPVAVALTFGLGRGFSGLWFGLLSAQVACAASVLTAVFLRTDWSLEAARARKLTAAGDERERELLVNGGVAV